MEQTEPKLTKITELAKLSWNVMSVRKMMLNYYTINNFERPMFRKADVAMTAFLQQLIKIIISSLVKFTSVDKMGMRNISVTNIKIALQIDKELNKYFLERYEHFRYSHSYELKITDSEFYSIVKQINGTHQRIKFTPKAKNFIHFMILTAFEDIMSVSLLFNKHAKNKSFHGRTIKYAIKMRFDGTIGNELCSEITRALILVEKEKDSKDDETNSSEDNGMNQNSSFDDDEDDDEDDEDDRKDTEYKIKKGK